MTVLLQLNPCLPLETPKGPGYAHLCIDYGMEFDLIWVVYIDKTGECWSFGNRDVRMQRNITMNRAPIP